MSGALPWLKCGVAVFSTIVTEAVLTPVQAEALATAIAEAECDPAPCRKVREFKSLQKLVFPRPRVKYTKEMLEGLFTGQFRKDTVGYFQEAFDALGRVPVAELAVFEACSRAYSARMQGDPRSAAAQEKHKKFLIAECARLKKKTYDAFGALLGHLEKAGLRSFEIPVEERFPPFLRALKRFDLPKIEMQILHDYGIGNDRIRKLCAFMIREVRVEDVPRTFEEFGRRLMGIMRRNEDIEMCRCSEPKA